MKKHLFTILITLFRQLLLPNLLLMAALKVGILYLITKNPTFLSNIKPAWEITELLEL